MFHIPGINGFGRRFVGTTHQQSIIDGAADTSCSRRFFKNSQILIGGEGDYSEAIADILNQEHNLVTTHPVPAWESRDDSIELGQTVGRATTMLFVGAKKGFQAALVMLVVFKKCRD